MTDQYVDAASDERIEAAVALTLQLRSQAPSRSLKEAVFSAVEQTFCNCVTGSEDAIEHHLSAVHGALLTEVLQRASERTLLSPDREKGWDRVDRASDASFPASDPPAWMGR